MTEIDRQLQRFCEHAELFKGYQPPTIKRYRQVIKFYSRWAGISNLDQVTPENVRALFLYGRTERDWSANTYINYHKTLTVFFRWCRSSGDLDCDPLEGIEIPKLPKRLPKKLSQQQTFKLLEVVQNYPYPYVFLRYRNTAIFQTFVFAGLRKSELLNLKVADVDLDNLTLFIRQGKGAKDRIVPISRSLAEELRRYEME
jgi:site-specific recombinase XerD